MNDVIETIYRTGRVEDAAGQPIDPFAEAIPYDEGKALYDLVRRTVPRHTLEIGMAYGLSSLFICQALRDAGGGTHVAIDPFETTRWQGIGMRNLQRAGLDDLARLAEAPSHEALPELLRAGRTFEVVFVDGNHRFDYTLLEFQYLDRMLPPNGCMVFDDIDLPAVRKVLTYVLRNKPYRLVGEYSPVVRSRSRRVRRLVKSLVRSPLDVSPAFTLSRHTRFCTLRKLADDETAWDFYRPF
jgi:predicted O-methyltransferase YrrM